MRNYQLVIKLALFFLFLGAVKPVSAQTSWFIDGYHGGVYGHYPMWQAKFMVDHLTSNPDWKICLEIEPETWDTVSVKDADSFRAFQEYYKKTGRFGRIEFVNPAWAQPYCFNISGESIIRQFGYGMKKIHQYFPDATFTTYSSEEPCFTSGLPQILKNFGFKYAVLRNPNTCWGGYTSGFGKELVNWIGPDGTSLPTVPRYACEDLSDKSTWQTESWSNTNAFIAKCFSDGIKYPVGMTFQDAGWDGGPWKNEYPQTVYETWTGYIDQVKDKVTPVDWNFSQEDVKPGLVWGAQVLQKIAQEVRVSENKLVTAEKMAAMNFILNGKEWPAADIAEAWRTLMLSQHHDCWIVPYNGKPGETWADHVTKWTDSSNRIANEKIAQLFNASGSSSEFIRVYNTLATERTDRVSIVVPKNADTDNLTVVDEKGEQKPVQFTVDGSGNEILQFLAKVPAMGYAPFSLGHEKKKSNVSAATLLPDGKLKVETKFYLAVIDPEKGGTITRLADKQNNRELVAEGKHLNNLCGFFYDENKFCEGASEAAKVTVAEDGALYTRIKIENEIAGNEYIQQITFNKFNPRIDFDLLIDWESQPGIGEYSQKTGYKAEDRKKAFYNDEYKLHLQFPLRDLAEKLFKNAPFDVCESKLSNTTYSSWDSIKHNVILNWVDAESVSGDYGVSLFTDHTTSYLHTPEMPLGLTVQYVGHGLWGRNYTLHGPTRISYALLPHSGNWEKAGVELSSAGWNEPLLGGFNSRPEKKGQFSLLQSPDKNLLVSSVTVSGSDLLVRFYNASSEKGLQEVYWNCMADKMEIVDLDGNTISLLLCEKKSNGQLLTKLSLPQFGFVTIKLTKVKLD